MLANNIIKHTKHWLSSFIIDYNICPFAKREYEKSSIHYAVIESTDIALCLELLIKECERLDSETTIATTLLIFPKILTDFDDYLDFLSLADSLLIDQQYEGTYQLASFHPDYCFDGENIEDPANYTNRSPYPMLHLIREVSLEKALDTYPNPEKIPDRNIILTRELGLKKLQSLLQNCYK